MSLKPLDPVHTTHLIREVDVALIPLLRTLEAEDWNRPAVGKWGVRDVTAHLLDGALRRLSLDRDGHSPPAPDRDLSIYGELVSFLNDLNTTWVTAAKRLSPGVMIELLEHICPQMADYFESLDPEAEAAFPVSWAGEESSRVWMDVAREFTERWHHQQQIREAVGAPHLDQERYVRPLLETLIRALPRSYASLEAAAGTKIEVRVSDMEDTKWILHRQSNAWQLRGSATALESDATILLSAETAWRLFTKGISGPEARRSATVVGDERLAVPFFATLAIMA